MSNVMRTVYQMMIDKAKAEGNEANKWYWEYMAMKHSRNMAVITAVILGVLLLVLSIIHAMPA